MCIHAHIDNWGEVRTAYFVAQLGTLSAAADALDVHHTTVLRHVSALEKKLKTKLFYRHPRGYAPTEAGKALLQVARATEDQFEELASRIKNDDSRVSGRLVITAVPELSPIIIPIIATYQATYPKTQIELLAEEKLLKLEYGEAHISIRAGSRPQESDNVIWPLIKVAVTLYAHKNYVLRCGRLPSLQHVAGHSFVTGRRAADRIAPLRWIEQHVPDEAIAFWGTGFQEIAAAVKAGIGIGPMMCWAAMSDEYLIPMIAPPDDWTADLWLVTHVDLHHSAKVQSFLKHLKRYIEPLASMIHGDDIRALFRPHTKWI